MTIKQNPLPEAAFQAVIDYLDMIAYNEAMVFLVTGQYSIYLN